MKSNPLEKTIEQQGCEFAARRGWLEVKVTSPTRRGWPDRMYIREAVVIFVEWKRDGKEPTEQQLLCHAEIRAHGGRVVVMDSIEQAYAVFR